MKELLIEEHGDVAVVRLNRGPTNFFTLTLIEETARALHACADQGARALVLASAGRHFSAGADLAADAGTVSRAELAERTYRAAVDVCRTPVPVIAAVTGAAVGGGLGLACAADFRVAAPSSAFHANFAAMAFHHGFGLTALLPRLIGDTAALDLLVSARRIRGPEAHRIGLVDRLTDEDSVDAEALAWAQEIAANGPLAVRAIKATMAGHVAERVEAAVARELAEQRRLWETHDSAVGVAASLTRSVPIFLGR